MATGMSKRTREDIQGEIDDLEHEIEQLRSDIEELTREFVNAPYGGIDVDGELDGYGIKVACPKRGYIELAQYKRDTSDALSEDDLVFKCDCGGRVLVAMGPGSLSSFTHEEKE